MFPLFELVEILNIGKRKTSNRRPAIIITTCAWKEAGDRSQLALLLSNGYLLLRYCGVGRRPVTRQLPWYQGYPIKHMCFDATGTWLLCVAQNLSIFIVPVLTLMDHKAKVNRLWRIDDITHVRIDRRGSPSCVAWWHTLTDQHIAVIGMENGKLLFVNMTTENVVVESEVTGHVTNIELIQDDRQSLTYALITTATGNQWRLNLEKRNVDWQWNVDKDVQNMGFEQIDSHHLPVDTIFQYSEEAKTTFIPSRFNKLPSGCHMTSQYAKGRHFVGIEDTNSQTFEVFDSNMEHSPLFVYSVPSDILEIVFTDRLTFTSHKMCKSVTVQSNQYAEFSSQQKGGTVKKNKVDATIQQFCLPGKTSIVKVYKKCYPFYWHEKREARAAFDSESESDSPTADGDISSNVTEGRSTGSEHKEVVAGQESPNASPSNVLRRMLKSFSFLNESSGNSPLDGDSSQIDDSLQSKESSSDGTEKQENSFRSTSSSAEGDSFSSKQDSITSSQLWSSGHMWTGSRVINDAEVYSIPVATHTVLDGCLIVTEESVYECRPRTSPERLFLHLAVNVSDTLAEKLGIMLGLDINALYKMAAEYTLTKGDHVHAVRLFQLSKCPHVQRVHAFAKHGRMSEVMTYIQQALGNRQGDLTDSDKCQLSDMVVHCFLYQLLNTNPDDRKLLGQFREFLVMNTSYNERTAMKMLAEFNFADLMFEVAKKRGFIIEAVELLVKNGKMELDSQQLKVLMAKEHGHEVAKIGHGAILRCMSSTDLVEFLLSKPSLALLYVVMLKDLLMELDEGMLLQVAHMFDPSKPVMRAFLSRAKRRSRASSLSSLNSFSAQSVASSKADKEESNQPDLISIVEFFLQVILHLNKVRGHGQMPLAFMRELTAGDAEKEEAPRRSSTQRSLVCQPQPVSCGLSHTGMVRCGELFMWGHSQYGKLGNGDRILADDVGHPALVDLLSSLSIRVTSIACGNHHTVALTNHGVYSWGCSKFGQVGVGTRNRYNRPMMIESLHGTDSTCVAVCCGHYHSMALMSDSKVYSWGWGAHGQLGHGCVEDELKPREITSLQTNMATKMSAGYAHSLVLSARGVLYSFGCALFGQLGHGDTLKHNKPCPISSFQEPVVQIATKFFHNLAVSVSGKLYTWGCSPVMLRLMAHDSRRSRTPSNPHSRQSIPEVNNHLMPRLIDTSSVSGKITQVACGATHSVCLTSRNLLYSWGRNAEGQLGLSHRQEQKLPIRVTLPADCSVQHVDCGLNFTVAMDDSSQAWAWGRNDKGQLGLHGLSQQLRVSQMPEREVLMDRTRPTLLPGFASFKEASHQGSAHSSDGRRRQDSSTEYWWSDDCYESEQELPPLPNLSMMSQPVYSPRVIGAIIENWPEHVNLIKLTRQCIDSGDYQTAADIYHVQGVYPQALYYRLKGLHLGYQSEHQGFTELVQKVVAFYIRKCQEQNVSESRRNQTLQHLLRHLIQFWHTSALCVAKLEHLLLSHLDTVGCFLSQVLFRNTKENPEDCTAWGGVPPAMQSKFSTKFCLQVASTVIQQIVESDPIAGGCLSTFDNYLCDVGMLPNVEAPSDHGVPSEKLWLEIVQNLRKDLKQRSHVFLSNADVSGLKSAIEKESNSTCFEDNVDKIDSGSLNVVVFTCGHHFSQKNFSESVLPMFAKDLSKGRTSLPNSANLLNKYYRSQGLKTMACPKCVLSSVQSDSKV